MATPEVGAGETRPPAQRPKGRMEGISQASARVPFRLKVAIVWIVIFLILAFLFNAAEFDTQFMRDRADFVVKGLIYTILIAVASIVLAIVLALIGALGRLSRNPVAFGVSGFYTSFFRGTPLIVQLFLITFALPVVVGNLGLPASVEELLTLDPFVAGIVALGLNYGAYMTEIFRAGIQSVSHGQSEAADALGMTYPQKMKRVVLPQAFRVIIPPTGNEFIAMMKDTALVSFIGVSATQAEIFRRAQLVAAADFKPIEAYLLAAGMYWALTAVFTFFQSRLERRISKGYVRGGTTKKPKKDAFPPASAAGGTAAGGAMVEIEPESEEESGGPEMGGQGH
ncbi:MAG TPA: amino acid ABC transporter permease [Actinomycetota bacterium]|nr:amino acid ABC transporter permease [Actinomycetota bacterium]